MGTHSGQEQEWHFPFSFPWVNVDAGGGALNQRFYMAYVADRLEGP